MTETLPWRYFVTYSGVKLPLTLVNELDESQLNHRNTYFRAQFTADNKPLLIQKMVYGDVQLEHRYQYDQTGTVRRAEITMDDETTVMEF